MNSFTKEDLKNILALLNRLNNIKGDEATTVAILQQKLQNAIAKETNVEPTTVQQPEATA
jgi:hypothetical protein